GQFETVGGGERQLAPGQAWTLRGAVSNGAGAPGGGYRAPGRYAGPPPLPVVPPPPPRGGVGFRATARTAPDGYTVEVAHPARQPAIAASGSDVWVAWQDERGTEIPHRSNIYLRHSADGGASWGSELQVSASTARALRPDIALVSARQPVVVWEDNSGGAFDV